MLLIQTITGKIKESMKAQDAPRTEALRFILAALQAKQKEMFGQAEGALSDEEAVKVLQKEAKKRKEAIALYEAGGRNDLSTKESFELAIIEEYLPAALGDAEIGGIVDECKAAGTKDFPGLMKAVMARVGGRADGKKVSEIIKQKLS